MPSQADGAWVSVFFYGFIIFGTYLLVDKLATLAWSAIRQLWPAFVLLAATLACVFCSWRALLLLRSETVFRCDVNLDKLDDDSLDDEDFDVEKQAEGCVKNVVREGPVVDTVSEESLSGAESAPLVFRTVYEDDPKGLLSTPLHRVAELAPEDYELLAREKYVKLEFVPLGRVRRETFYIKPQSRETLAHTFVLHSIVQQLKDKVGALKVGGNAKTPDITFTHNGKSYAVEVVGPLQHARFFTKAESMKRKYGSNWCIVVTHSAYARPFREYAPVLTRNQVPQWIQNGFDTERTHRARE